MLVSPVRVVMAGLLFRVEPAAVTTIGAAARDVEPVALVAEDVEVDQAGLEPGRAGRRERQAKADVRDSMLD